MANDISSVKQPEESASVALTKGMEMMIAGFIPNTRYFDSRFDLLQVQVDLLQKGLITMVSAALFPPNI